MFRAGRAEDEARAAGLVVRDVESWSGCKEERLGLSGRGSRQVRGQSDGDSGQSVSEVSGSARRSSAGNGGKRVPLGAGGLLESKLEWMAGSSSTGVYLRRAGRHCDPARTAHVPRAPTGATVQVRTLVERHERESI